jgi:hypothetical protein
MDDYIDDIDRINVVERLIRREQVIRDRQNPFLNYSEDEFIDRYRLNKECVLSILAEIVWNQNRKSYHQFRLLISF